MSNSSKAPSSESRKREKISPRGYHVAIGFHPELRLETKRGLEYAAELADFIDPSNVSLEPHQWKFSQPMSGSARSQLDVVVGRNQIQIIAAFPTLAKEWFEDRQVTVFEKFGSFFSPEIILQSAVMIQGTLGIGGDAREFLAKQVMNLDEAHLQSFGRPIHVIGMRLFFPPFKSPSTEGAKVTDWQLEVKIESLAEDPTQLYLEADARWSQPKPWSKENIEEIVQRQGEVAANVERHVARFLQGADNGKGEEQ